MDANPTELLKERLDLLLDQVRDEFEGSDLVARILDIRERLEDYVVNYPLRSLAIGVLAGIILGKLFSSNEQD